MGFDKIRIYSLTSDADHQVRHYLVIGDADTGVSDEFLSATYDCPTDKVNTASTICRRSTGMSIEVVKRQIVKLGAKEIDS